MSPRNDTYLSLCLAQAELSALHYRHGSIIVRGGKVIGQGFNSYRPGFDGGAIRHDGPAIAELKQRLKPNPKLKAKWREDSGTLKSQGQGHNSNTPLSMHSEMMAIRSALSLSSGTLSSQTSARSAKCYTKPCFSLPGGSKLRKLRARTLTAYAQAVLAEAEASAGKTNTKPRLQKSGFEARSSQPGSPVQRGKQWVSRGEECRGGGREGECRVLPSHCLQTLPL
jgi:deoxycytidylate deaminase